MTLCLFPAEDLHRASLWPAATMAEFWTRTLGLVRPAQSDDVPIPVACNTSVPTVVVSPTVITGDSPNDAENFSRLDVDDGQETLPACQVRLRFRTLPILIFHVHASSSHDMSAGWQPLCFLTLEFRSDCGLWWHVYHEFPPGLRNQTAGSTDLVFSCQTMFGVAALRHALQAVRDKQYNPTRWSGWEFSETVLQMCCPSISQQLLQPPIAETLD